MRAAVAVPFLEPGRAGGGELAARALIRGLDDIDSGEHEITAIGSRLNAGWMEGFGLRNLRAEILPIQAPRGRLRRGLTLFRQGVLAHRSIRALQNSFDLIHFPLLPAVRVPGVRTLVTAWDIQHHDFPNHYELATRAFRRLVYDRSMRRTDLVLVPTEFTAGRMRSALGLDESRVRVVTPGVLWPADLNYNHALSAALESRGVRQPFALYPATWWPHKNHETLIAEIACIPAEIGMSLVLVGGPSDAPKWAKQTSRRHGVGDRVVHLGHVADDTLEQLYRGATALAYPSLYEGFGIPPLEAMRAGTPVVAADIPPLREVVADSGLLVEPGKPGEFAKALERIYTDGPLRKRLVLRGRDRSDDFSITAGARRHLEAYAQAVASTAGVGGAGPDPVSRAA